MQKKNNLIEENEKNIHSLETVISDLFNNLEINKEILDQLLKLPNSKILEMNLDDSYDIDQILNSIGLLATSEEDGKKLLESLKESNSALIANKIKLLFLYKQIKSQHDVYSSIEDIKSEIKNIKFENEQIKQNEKYIEMLKESAESAIIQKKYDTLQNFEKLLRGKFSINQKKLLETAFNKIFEKVFEDIKSGKKKPNQTRDVKENEIKPENRKLIQEVFENSKIKSLNLSKIKDQIYK